MSSLFVHTVEKLKQENWDLEISIQTLKTHLEETTGQWTRSMTEHRKTQDQLRASRDQVEVMEAQKEKMSQQFEQQRLLLVRERKELKKENAYLQQELDQTSAELRIWKSKTITRDAGVEAASSKGKQEVEALLKQSLAHAHRMIIELRASLDQEKIGRMETKKLLEESQETIEALRTREKGVRRSLVMGRRREPPLAVIEEEDSEATPPARSLYSELACQRIDKGVQTTESSIIPDAHSKVVQSGDDRPARTIRRVRKRITRSANKDSRLVQNAQRQYSYAKKALAPYMPLSSDSSCVDPSVVAAITRTMIGECMWKGTRRYVMGRNGLSQVKGHSRYFWIHPYTMTLYWSATQPGANHKESKSKRAFIQDAWAVQSENQVVSILVQTPSRYITLTALTLESHNVWLLVRIKSPFDPLIMHLFTQFPGSILSARSTGNDESVLNYAILKWSYPIPKVRQSLLLFEPRYPKNIFHYSSQRFTRSKSLHL